MTFDKHREETMTDASDSGELERLKGELIEAASTLFAVQVYQGERVREQSLAAFGKLVDAHLLTMGVLGTALLRVNGKFSETTPTSIQRNALFASFVIGIPVCERTICEGHYLQAGALLRQEVETLAALSEVTAGNRKDGRVPNLGSLEPSIARLYGDLSAAAHVAKHHIVNAATEWNQSIYGAPGPAAVARHFPVFDESVARRFYALHIYLILRLVEQLSIDFSAQRHDAFTQREARAVGVAINLMIEEKALERDTP
jgi:hypothetical protein